MYILVLLFAVHYGGNASFQEFTTKDKCERTKTSIVLASQQYAKDNHNSFIVPVVAYCTPK